MHASKMAKGTLKRRTAARQKRVLGVVRRTGRDGKRPVIVPIEKFVPNADEPFAVMARKFVNRIVSHREVYNITDEDVELLQQTVTMFEEGLRRATMPHSRNTEAIREKRKTRAAAEELVRRFARFIRGDDLISVEDKQALGILMRPAKLDKRFCPQTPPVLKYICGIDATGEYVGRHIVEFSDLNAEGTNRKPAGAARLELFAELVPPDVEATDGIPRHPADLTGRPLYMGSFTRSPMEVEFPVSMSGPMRVVYWGRWADAKGKWGPFSQVCVARLEGGNPKALPQSMREAAVRITDVRVRYIYVQAPHLLPDLREVKQAVGAGIADLPQQVLEAATTKLLNAA